jgi:hypothetical protein
MMAWQTMSVLLRMLMMMLMLPWTMTTGAMPPW